MLLLALGLAGTARAADGVLDAPTLLRTTDVTVTISNLSQQFDGEPRPVTVTTDPSGVSTRTTYNNSTTAPTATGSYTVVATVTQANYQGSATATLSIYAGSATTGTTTATATATATTTGTTTGLVLGLALWGRRRMGILLLR